MPVVLIQTELAYLRIHEAFPSSLAYRRCLEVEILESTPPNGLLANLGSRGSPNR